MSNEQNIGGVRVWVSDVPGVPTAGHLEIIQMSNEIDLKAVGATIDRLTRERDEARAELGAWRSAANTWEATATAHEARLSAHARVVEAARDALARIESDIESPGRTIAEGDALRQALADLDAGKAGEG